MNQRIELLLRIKDVTASKFAEMLGVQPSNISHILSGRNKPSLDFIIKVVEAFPDISLDWLIFGKGNMYSQMNAISAEKEIEQLKLEVEKLNKTSNDFDLFSQLDTINENPKTVDNSEEKIIHEKLEDLKVEKSEEIVIQNNEDEASKAEESKENISIENNEKIQPSVIEDKVSVSEENIQSQKENKVSENLALFSKSQPSKIILIYEDESFEIIENRKTKY